MINLQDTNFIEVFEVEPGRGRPYYTYKPGAIEFLPTDAPLPQIGDILLLPSNFTGDNEDQAFLMSGMFTPFRVVEREHLYLRGPDEKHDPTNTKPARYSKTWIFVRRVAEEEYAADPGSTN